MYQKEEYDYLFYQIKSNIPNHKVLFMIISIIKLYPLCLLVHSGGFLDEPDTLSTFHKYFSYFSLSYYILNSFTAKNIILITLIITVINILLVGLLLYYIIQIKKQQSQGHKYSNSPPFGTLFSIFSNTAFFKYIILFQFFFEINSLPLICIPNVIDITKLRANQIYSNIDSFLLTQNDLCHKSNLYIMCFLPGFNIVIDLFFYWIITSRFFDFNVLSIYKWNFYPNAIFSFEFLENCTQTFFILFLNYHPKTYKILLTIYVGIIFFVNSFQYFNQNTFCTAYTYIYVYVSDYIRLMCLIATIINSVFFFGFNAVPNDINMIEMLIFELIAVYIIMKLLLYNNEKALVKKILVSSLNDLNDKNIYITLIVLIKEFIVFNDVSHKFSDRTLDIFLENYVNHLKSCEDRLCPCKNYVKKVIGTSNTIRSGYTTMINLPRIKKDQQEEYILNKFFNVLSSNIGASVKQTTNNINVNNMKDDQRQKLIYQLRIKLIKAVKSLIIYKLEKLTNDINGILSSHFSNKAKDFIRINYFSLNIFINKAYYKTQFLFQEYLTNLFKRTGQGYRSNMIYYLYLKMFSVKEYNDNLNVNKQSRKERSHLSADFTKVLSLCVKYYEIEDHLIQTVIAYETFITYYSKDEMVFKDILKYARSLQSRYQRLIEYVNFNFKNDKINNLFVCTKIILLYKVIHFDVPETLHNKLIIQSHENEVLEKSNSNPESNYFIILSYCQGEFVIKFISHELLLVLEYSEDELKDKEFDILLPYKLRKFHKNAIISEIKSPKNAYSNKEVFLITKSNVCILLDLRYKFLLSPNGDITLLSKGRFKKTSNKEFRTAFICIDNNGDVLAINKEFEEYMLLSIKMLDYIKIDTEKLILQSNGQRMRNYFKDEENSVFQENFDYELYLLSLFDEEFDVYKEKDEREYNRKKARWELLKEMNRKGRYYTRYLEFNIKQRKLNGEVLYFITYNVKLSVSLRSFEPQSTTLSLIHAVKISKREMAKLSFYRGEQLFEYKSERSSNEDKANESQDDLFESQSQMSSAVTQLKEKNTIRLFYQNVNFYRFNSKKRNLLWLIISIAIFGALSVLTNMIVLIFKTRLHNDLYDYFILQFDTIALKRSIMTLSSASISVSLYHEIVINDTMKTKAYLDTVEDLIEKESELLSEISYNISVKNSLFFMKHIDTLMTHTGIVNYILKTGELYSKSESLFLEILEINKQCHHILHAYNNSQLNNIDLFKKYFFMNRIKEYQANLTIAGITLNEIEMEVYFLYNNLFEIFDGYMDSIISTYEELFVSKRNSTLKSLIGIKFIEFSLICLVIGMEWLFVNFGYDQAKKKMVCLRHKIEKNDIEVTINKIIQFIHFSNAFDINSLYYIADLDLRKIEESTKTLDVLQSKGSSLDISPVALASESNHALSPRKKNNTLINIHHKEAIAVSKQKSRTIELNKEERDLMIGVRANISSKNNRGNYAKDIIDYKLNSNSNNNNNNAKDNKENLLKVINKLDQIKGMKINSIEKKESEESNKSNKNNELLNDSHSESSVRDENHKADNENENKNDNNQTEKQIKSVLKTETKTNQDNNNKVYVNEDNMSSVNINNDCINHDETKSPIIKQGEEVKTLLTKNTRTTKVQFKEKNVRYYSPIQNVNEASELNPNNYKVSKEQRDSSLVEPIQNEDSQDINQIQSSLLSALQDNNQQLIIQTEYNDSKSKYSISKNNSNSSNNNKENKGNMSLGKLKDNSKDLSKYNLIDQGKAVTVKKMKDSKDKQTLSKEVIADKIEKVVYRNQYARIILNLALAIFISVYLISMMINYQHHIKISNASLYGSILLNKTCLYKMLLLKYQISLIKGEYDNEIVDFVLKTEENKKQIADFESSKSVSQFTLIKGIQLSYHRNDSCALFADNYSREFNTSRDIEYDRCMTVGGQINVNGFENAETYLLSTVIMLISDWKNRASDKNEINNDVIITKLTGNEYYNIIFELDGVLRKNQLVMTKYFIQDTEEIIKNVVYNEDVLGYLSVGLDAIFFILSLIFIVYPIKSVEKLITWLINKLVTN